MAFKIKKSPEICVREFHNFKKLKTCFFDLIVVGQLCINLTKSAKLFFVLVLSV